MYFKLVRVFEGYWCRFKQLTALERSIVCVVAVLLLAAPVWRWWSYAQQWEMQTLYNSAMTGNIVSVRSMSHQTFSQSTEWLEKLAEDRNADPYARVAAIEELMDKRSATKRRIVPLLWIQVPYVVRHEAALWFKKRGCDEDCTRMALDCLHSIWGGKATLEMQLSNGEDRNHSPDDIAEDLRNRTESDYISLLSSAPCTCHRYLQSDYAADREFAGRVEGKLTASCPAAR